jgi:hypothetical protein
MMRKNNNGGKNNNYKNRSGGGGQRRYGSSSSGNNGGHRQGGSHDGQNLQRQKHHATQMREKYSNMARDAQINGDRVDVEYYLQHVDHYTRVLTDIGAIEAERFAHQRDQQAHHAPVASDQPADGSAAPASDEATATPRDGVTDIAENTHQPRMTRHRQPRTQPPQNNAEHDPNGAKEANSNTTEIPLPDNILPPI